MPQLHPPQSPPAKPRSKDAWTLPLELARAADAAQAGQEAASLGELCRAGVEISAGFVVVAAACRRFLEASGVEQVLPEWLAVGPGAAGCDEASRRARALLLSTPIPEEIATEVRQAYLGLSWPSQVELTVALSPSPTRPAPQHALPPPALHVQGVEPLLAQVRRFWAALYTPERLRHRVAEAAEPAPFALLVQALPSVDASGLAFERHDEAGPPRTVLRCGLGLAAWQPAHAADLDRFEVDAANGAMLSATVARKLSRAVAGPDGQMAEEPVDGMLGDAPTLTPEEVAYVAELVGLAHQALGGPQELRFTVQWDGRRTLRIVHARAPG